MAYENSLMVHSNPKSPIAEAYRVLRTNIQFASVDKPIKVIVVTSSRPGEGKTTTISNLAITFAQTGSKVLLIDADLRKPRIHKVFHLPNNDGMTTILANRLNYADGITGCNIDNLYILTSGPIPPNPSEMLSSKAMKNLIECVCNDYDIVLIDAPPVGIVTDAAILSTIADGTILVVPSGYVEVEVAQRAKDLLEKVNANILGVVLNRVSKQTQGNYYSYYYYYSDESDGKENKSNKHNKKNKKQKY